MCLELSELPGIFIIGVGVLEIFEILLDFFFLETDFIEILSFQSSISDRLDASIDDSLEIRSELAFELDKFLDFARWRIRAVISIRTILGKDTGKRTDDRSNSNDGRENFS